MNEQKPTTKNLDFFLKVIGKSTDNIFCNPKEDKTITEKTRKNHALDGTRNQERNGKILFISGKKKV